MTEGQGVRAFPAPFGGAGPKAPVPAPNGEPNQNRAIEDDNEAQALVDARKLESALLAIRDPIVRAPLLLDCPGIEDSRAERKQLISQIDDYMLPRLRQAGAPLLIALVGSTGAGKSTLLNSIVGSQVSATGIRRPTTNSPVLACHPDDVRWYAENIFLPTLPRVRQQGLAMPGRDGLLVLAANEGMPRGVAVLDTPDIDSVVAAHRQFARQFLAASDLWLFVTTARRYADAVVWELLKDARDRGASLGIVLSRVPPPATDQLTSHFDAMLDANGLGDVERFVVPETTVENSMLPAGVADPVRDWLKETAAKDDRRIAILTQTMSGVLDTFAVRVPALASQVEEQLSLRAELRSAADAAYAAGLAELDEATRSGALLRGEVQARWQDFAGTGDLVRTLEVRSGRRPGRRSKRQATSARVKALKAALAASLGALIVSVADRAAADADGRWRASPAGAALLEEAQNAKTARKETGLTFPLLGRWQGDLAGTIPGGQAALAAALPDGGVDTLARSRPELAAEVAATVAGWQDYLLHLVQNENVTKRSIARVASFDPESLSLVLTVAVLGYGAGDVTISEGTSAVPQKLLTSLFGAGLVRDIGARARHNLHERVGVLFAADSRRYATLIDAVGALEQSIPTELYQASYALESVR